MMITRNLGKFSKTIRITIGNDWEVRFTDLKFWSTWSKEHQAPVRLTQWKVFYTERTDKWTIDRRTDEPTNVWTDECTKRIKTNGWSLLRTRMRMRNNIFNTKKLARYEFIFNCDQPIKQAEKIKKSLIKPPCGLTCAIIKPKGYFNWFVVHRTLYGIMWHESSKNVVTLQASVFERIQRELFMNWLLGLTNYY